MGNGAFEPHVSRGEPSFGSLLATLLARTIILQMHSATAGYHNNKNVVVPAKAHAKITGAALRFSALLHLHTFVRRLIAVRVFPHRAALLLKAA